MTNRNDFFQPRHAKTEGQMDVAVFHGTSQLALLDQRHLLNADAIIVIDNEEELRPYRQRLAGEGHVHFFGLGEGQTAMTLVNDGSPKVRRCIKTMANMSAAEGMGQVRLFGDAGAKQLVDGKNFARFVQWLADDLDRAAGGNLKRVCFRFYLSICGGTGTGALRVARALEREILAWREVRVHTALVPLGPKTFLGLGGRRMDLTAAATLADFVAFTISHEINEFVTRSLDVSELPPSGTDQAMRNTYLLAMTQAISASSVRRHLSRIAPNHSPDSRYGNITIRHLQFANFISREVIADEVAPAYLDAIEDTRRQMAPNPSLIDGIELDDAKIPLSREPLETVIATSENRTVDDMVTSLCRPTVRHQLCVRSELATGDEYELTTYSTAAATAPRTLSEIRRLLIEQVSLQHVLAQEIKLAAGQIEDHSQQMEDATEGLRAAHAALYGQDIWNRIRRWWTCSGVFERQLHSCSADLQTLSDRRHRLQAELAALQRSKSEVEKAMQFRLDRLAAICVELAKHRLRGHKAVREPQIEVAPIDTVWPLLDDLDSLEPGEQLNRLCYGAHGVTIAGLATIAGAPHAELEGIAKKLAEREYPIQGPHWCGIKRPDASERFLILPPATTAIQDRLRVLIASHDAQLRVHFTEHASAGLNAVRVSLFRVRSSQELFVGPLLPALVAAYQSPHREIYFPLGTGCLDILGITIHDDGTVTFRDEDES